MNTKTIVILGDSTSMSIGAERETYPFLLSEMKVWIPRSKIINCSIPGFTSSDACAFFFNNLHTFGDIQSVIIYLGNCDTMASELHKGKYTLYCQYKFKIMNLVKKKEKRKKLNNRLLHYTWNATYDKNIELPVSTADYEYNISRIINYCANKKIKVLLVRPLAHKHFPSGSGNGNFVFYHYFDLNDKIADLLFVPDLRFPQAVRQYESGQYLQAAAKYKEILLEDGPLSENLEYQTLVVHNYAVCKAKLGAFAEAGYLLELMLNERGTRKEIVLYNLALFAKAVGDHDKYTAMINESYETDQSMYRIREPYKMAVDNISKRFPEAIVINQSTMLTDNDFVDHCHPLPEAQLLLAKNIYEKIKNDMHVGTSKLELVNHLYNPEYSLGNNTEFHAYFKTASSLSEQEIEKCISELAVVVSKLPKQHKQTEVLEKLPDAIKLAFEYYQRHPCFTRIYDILMLKPKYPIDVGRFPEFFIIRFLIPYIKETEKNPHLCGRFSSDTSILRNSRNLTNILPEVAHKWIANALPSLDEVYLRDWLSVIIHNVHSLLICHLKKLNQINSRLKATMFWYFRETLRFGSHSRISMRYERVVLENIAEALAVAGVIDFLVGGKKSSEICHLISSLEDAVKIHEKFCREFKPEEDNGKLLIEYDRHLLALCESLQNNDCHMYKQERGL